MKANRDSLWLMSMLLFAACGGSSTTPISSQADAAMDAGSPIDTGNLLDAGQPQDTGIEDIVRPTDTGRDAGRDTGPVDAARDVGSVDTVHYPRPVAPISLGDVTQLRPTLRWVLPARFDGAVVELCRDRACTMVLETLTVRGTSARPGADLPARSVVFWRLRGRIGTTTDTVYSPTWLFHLPATSASSGIDTSYNPHFDVNGDGFDDLVVGASPASPGGRYAAGTASVYHGSGSGIGPTPAVVLEGAAESDRFGIVACAGDVNGDGYADLVVGAHEASPGGRLRSGTASVFHGTGSGIAVAPVRVFEGGRAHDYFGHSVASAGSAPDDGSRGIVGVYQAVLGERSRAGNAGVLRRRGAGFEATSALLFVNHPRNGFDALWARLDRTEGYTGIQRDPLTGLRD